ncbi:MAG TPA: fumarate hydratase [Sphingobacteriaceae bacterium]
MRKSFIFVLLPFLLCACKFNPNLQGRGEAVLQGVWEEDRVMYQDTLLQSTKHHITFSCDSFYLTLKTTSEINRYPDSCFNNGVWMEYVKGTYLTKNDSLFLLGTFTKPDFKQKISGCYRIGTYKPVYLMKETSDSTLELQSLHDHIPVRLTLKQRINCVPKPL